MRRAKTIQSDKVLHNVQVLYANAKTQHSVIGITLQRWWCRPLILAKQSMKNVSLAVLRRVLRSMPASVGVELGRVHHLSAWDRGGVGGDEVMVGTLRNSGLQHICPALGPWRGRGAGSPWAGGRLYHSFMTSWFFLSYSVLTNVRTVNMSGRGEPDFL